MPTQIPAIETARLILRGHQPEDLPARQQMTADQHIIRHMGGIALDLEENWTRILRYNGHWSMFGHGIFAIEEKATGKFVGEAGFAHFHRGLGKDFDGFREGTWMVAQHAQGRGYASEAIAAILSWQMGDYNTIRLVCMIGHQNRPSLRLAERFGFHIFANREYSGVPRLLLTRKPRCANG